MTEAVDSAYGGSVTQSVSFAYDVFGNLVEKTVTNSSGSTVQKFAYDGSNIYANLDGSGNVVTLYVTGAGSGALYGRIQSGTVYWIAQDYQGLVREIISADGSTVLDAVTYTDTGSISSQTGLTFMGNYGYTGLRYESVTGYYVAQDRWYNSSIAQWNEIDPIGVAGGLSNFRNYVGNDWVNATYSSGLAFVTRGRVLLT